VSVVVLYGRAGCHLCDEARSVLERLRREIPFDLVERDIDTDEAWQRAYFERVPVVALDGREVFDYFVEEEQLRRLLGARHTASDDLQSER
jgi:glutaredoxin